MPIVIIQKKNSLGVVTNDMRVRRMHIEKWLRWLKLNSPINGYKNLIICDDRLNDLPLDGFLEGIRVIETDDEEVEIALHRDNADNIENTEVFDDIDGNPSSDSGVPLPAENLISDLDSINNVINSIDGKY